MEYINFITDPIVLSNSIGSPKEEIDRLEMELGYKLPKALFEYLYLMGEKSILFKFCEAEGTSSIVNLKKTMYELIADYRASGFPLDEIGNVLPFFHALDTFFFIPINKDAENPPVLAFDTFEIPEVRVLSNSFTNFINKKYHEFY